MRGRGRALRRNNFSTGLCEKEAESGRDVCCRESIQSSLTAQEQKAYHDGVPDVGKPTRTALQLFFWSWRSTSRALDARPGRSRRRLLPSQGRNLRMQQRCRCRPGAQSEETGTMGQLYHSAAFFSYSIIMYSKPEFAVSLAPCFFPFACTTCGSRGASKKKCWFMVWCRERPAWWGALVKDSFQLACDLMSKVLNLPCEKGLKSTSVHCSPA